MRAVSSIGASVGIGTGGPPMVPVGTPPIFASPGFGASPGALAAASSPGPTITTADIFRSLGAGATVFGALTERDELRSMSRLRGIQAERERIRGIEQANRINEELVENLARNNALVAASGFSPLGSFDNVQAELLRDADRELSIARNNASVESEVKRIEAATFRSRSKGALAKGAAQLATSLIKV